MSNNLKKNKYIGMTNTMNNGMKATIIEYRNYKDIDVQFEDGTVVYNKDVFKFQNGTIAHPGMNTINERRKNKYLGMTKTMKNGMKATIIEYRNSMDIDVQFEDGTIVCNKDVVSFQNGTIGCPGVDNMDYSNVWVWQGDKYLGEVNIMKNGRKATIIEYRNYMDIDVQFEDGTIVCNKTVSSFKLGTIAHPGMNTINERRKNKYLGMTKTMNNGMKATIIGYRNWYDIDVQFEDGTVVCNRVVGDFKRGAIANPNLKRGKKDGQK